MKQQIGMLLKVKILILVCIAFVIIAFLIIWSIKNTTRIRNFDEALWNIINETASDFFNGLITAETAARIIQNRASIYISEKH